MDFSNVFGEAVDVWEVEKTLEMRGTHESQPTTFRVEILRRPSGMAYRSRVYRWEPARITPPGSSGEGGRPAQPQPALGMWVQFQEFPLDSETAEDALKGVLNVMRPHVLGKR